MSIKSKMMTLITTFVLLTAMLVIGVFAIKKTDFEITGNIKFKATGIEATIENTGFTGILTNGTVGTDKLTTINLDTSMNSTQIAEAFESWKNLSMTFGSDGADVILKLRITNNAESGADNYIYSEITVDEGTSSNCTVTAVNDYSNSNIAMIAPQEFSDFTITFSVTDKKVDASLTGFAITFNLQYKKLEDFPTAEDYSDVLAFIFDESAQTASVAAANTSITSAEIPSILLRENGVVYRVTEISNSAFRNCSNLKNLTIPNSITKIGVVAFDGCSNLSYNTDNSANYLGNSSNKYLVLISAIDTSITSCSINENCKIIYHFAFSDCSSLTNITIPASVTSIGNGAFSNALTEMNYLGDINSWVNISFYGLNSNPTYYTKSLKIQGSEVTSVIIDTATSIGAQAFYNCTRLTSVEIGNQVTSIGDSAFYNCTGLTSVETGSQVTIIGNSAFYGCSGLISATIDSATIGNSAFYNCTKLTNLTIGNQITSIGSYVFNNCSNLNYNIYDNANYLGNSSNGYLLLVSAIDTTISSCTINENCKIIYQDAFKNCSEITSIEIPSSVTSIGSSAFYKCTELTNIEIPSSVTSIGSIVFQGCSGLVTIVVEDGNKVYDSRDNCNAIIETTTNKLIQGCSNTVIPTNVVNIGNSAFRDHSSLTSIVIPSGVTSIGESAFYGCTGLSSITIGSNVTNIGKTAFTSCSKLTEMNYLGDINSWVSISFGDRQSNPTYYTKSLKIQGSVVTSAIIDKATSIGTQAFYNCTGLTNVEIGSQVKEIGASAFYGCSKLAEMNYLGDINSWVSIYFGGKEANPTYYTKSLKIQGSEVTSAVIDTATSINGYAFYNCTGLTSVEIGNQVTSIGYQSFSGSGLTSIEIPSSVTSIGNYAFSNGLTEINYLGDINSWVSISFDGELANPTCRTQSLKIQGSEVTSAVIDTATSINGYAFYNCTGLTSVEIGSQVTSIGNYAFYKCTGLTNIEIPSSVTSIGSKAFYNCTGLTSIKIPSSVTSIGGSAFYGCNALTTVTIDSEDISKLLTSLTASGNIIGYATTIYVKDGLEVGSYLSDITKYTVGTSDMAGYVMYNIVV